MSLLKHQFSKAAENSLKETNKHTTKPQIQETQNVLFKSSLTFLGSVLQIFRNRNRKMMLSHIVFVPALTFEGVKEQPRMRKGVNMKYSYQELFCHETALLFQKNSAVETYTIELQNS